MQNPKPKLAGTLAELTGNWMRGDKKWLESVKVPDQSGIRGKLADLLMGLYENDGFIEVQKGKVKAKMGKLEVEHAIFEKETMAKIAKLIADLRKAEADLQKEIATMANVEDGMVELVRSHVSKVVSGFNEFMSDLVHIKQRGCWWRDRDVPNQEKYTEGVPYYIIPDDSPLIEKKNKDVARFLCAKGGYCVFRINGVYVLVRKADDDDWDVDIDAVLDLRTSWIIGANEYDDQAAHVAHEQIELACKIEERLIEDGLLRKTDLPETGT